MTQQQHSNAKKTLQNLKMSSMEKLKSTTAEMTKQQTKMNNASTTEAELSFPKMKSVQVIRKENEVFPAVAIGELNPASAIKDRTEQTTVSQATAVDSTSETPGKIGMDKDGNYGKGGSIYGMENKERKCSQRTVMIAIIVPVVVVVVALALYFTAVTESTTITSTDLNKVSTEVNSTVLMSKISIFNVSSSLMPSTYFTVNRTIFRVNKSITADNEIETTTNDTLTLLRI